MEPQQTPPTPTLEETVQTEQLKEPAQASDAPEPEMYQSLDIPAGDNDEADADDEDSFDGFLAPYPRHESFFD